MIDLPPGPANFVPLSPCSFLARTAAVFGARDAIVHGGARQSWAATYARCRQLASALAARGISRGETVAIVAPNTPAMIEAHFGVPMAGAVLCAINVRLEAETVAYILEHSRARVVLVDREFAGTMAAALARLAVRPLVVDIEDALAPAGATVGAMTYEELLAEGSAEADWAGPGDEWDPIALNYTSGTTGRPKGVVYHHRGAYLNALGNAVTWGMAAHPVYLWTLPLFHCNGWCFAWTVAALGGTNVCLRRVEAGAIFESIAAEGVTHLCGAPIVMGMLLNHPGVSRTPEPVRMMTAGAAPPAAVLEGLAGLNFDVTHVYGLTETYGPVAVCAWNPAWDARPVAQQAALKARQGVASVVQEAIMVADPATMLPVLADGVAMGEVMMRGNIVMRGYLDAPEETASAFAGGWFHTGDLAVVHPDGYLEIRDRSKDIIISGGENISTIEVEGALYRHPAVLEAAVVARPDTKWGETPCAFVTLKPGAAATAEDLMLHCRGLLAGFKVPRTVVFGPLPKTSTGKMQKFVLRQQAREIGG